jgi:hypothetical protein
LVHGGQRGTPGGRLDLDGALRAMARSVSA